MMAASPHTLFYGIAGLPLSLTLPQRVDAAAYLPSFLPFTQASYPPTQRGALHIDASRGWEIPEKRLLLDPTAGKEGSLSSLGETSEGNIVFTVRCAPNAATHEAVCSPDFSQVKINVKWEDPWSPLALSSLIRMAFSQAITSRNGLAIHASAVEVDGNAYIFLGPSGTGKSTHAGLWLDLFQQATLINDDNPVIAIDADGIPRVFGTPWSGKTPCYRDVNFPLRGIARIRQSKENVFEPQEDIQRFVTLLPSCCGFRTNPHVGRLHDTIAEIAGHESVKVGIMQCTPSPAAAKICAQGLMENLR